MGNVGTVVYGDYVMFGWLVCMPCLRAADVSYRHHTHYRSKSCCEFFLKWKEVTGVCCLGYTVFSPYIFSLRACSVGHVHVFLRHDAGVLWTLVRCRSLDTARLRLAVASVASRHDFKSGWPVVGIFIEFSGFINIFWSVRGCSVALEQLSRWGAHVARLRAAF
jgi:hypothetical protein